MRLTETTLLQDLDRPEMAPLRKLFVSRKFAKGAMVFEPKSGDQIFIVTRGRARVYLAYRDKEFTMAMLDSGDVYATHTRAFVQGLHEGSGVRGVDIPGVEHGHGEFLVAVGEVHEIGRASCRERV